MIKAICAWRTARWSLARGCITTPLPRSTPTCRRFSAATHRNRAPHGRGAHHPSPADEGPAAISRLAQDDPRALALSMGRPATRLHSPVFALGHSITHSRLGEEVGRIAAILSELAAQAAQVGAQRAQVIRLRHPPNSAQKLVVGHHASRIHRQLIEQLVLLGPQFQGAASIGDPPLVIVDDQAAVDVWLTRRLVAGVRPATQGRPDAGDELST